MEVEMSSIVGHFGNTTVDRLHISWEEGEVAWKVRLAGVLRLGEGRALFDALVDKVSELNAGLIVNLSGVERVDSNGIGSLVGATARLGHRVRFVGLFDRLAPLAAVCKLTAVLPQSQDETAAVDELSR
jgi:anti-anti-sigma regulatory factor